MNETARHATEGAFTNPIGGVALGDPFVLRYRGQFYLYGTNDGPPLADGRAIPVYRSDDLIHWTPLGGALEMIEPTADHWAPEVMAWNGKFYMVVSFGDVERTGHALWVAVADRPEGPFRLRSRVSGPDERFSIDGSWLLDDDGRLYLYRCLDFVDDADPPHGTGIVVQEMADPFTPIGRPATVLRAHAPWHLFEANRPMPLYERRTFAAWNTIEGPAPVRRNGKVYCGYSGGNYTGAYGTGEAVADRPLGPYRDARGAAGPIFGTKPGLVEGPGHFSVVRPDGVHDWIVLHGRRPGEPGRRVWLCPADWGDEGVTIGALTDRPQSAPPLPRDLSRFDSSEGSPLVGWTPDGGHWELDGDGLRQYGDGDSTVWRDGLRLEGDWAIEAWVRLPDTGEGNVAGLWLRSAESACSIDLGRDSLLFRTHEGLTSHATLPTLGDAPFDPSRYHAIEVRSRGGRAEVRLDGVLVVDDAVIANGPARLGLHARGIAAFDAVAVTMIVP